MALRIILVIFICSFAVLKSYICTAQNKDIFDQLNNDTKYWVTMLSYKHGIYEKDIIETLIPVIEDIEDSIINGKDPKDIKIFKDDKDIDTIKNIAKQFNKQLDQIAGIVFDYEVLKRAGSCSK